MRKLHLKYLFYQLNSVFDSIWNPFLKSCSHKQKLLDSSWYYLKLDALRFLIDELFEILA